jgi:hypothetical protein
MWRRKVRVAAVVWLTGEVWLPSSCSRAAVVNYSIKRKVSNAHSLLSDNNLTSLQT